jgi:hypothetical protein
MFTPVNTRSVDIATNLQFLHKQTRLTLEIELLNCSVCSGTAVKGFSGEERLVLCTVTIDADRILLRRQSTIDNNVSEREMKRFVLKRKNTLFVGNARGG